MNTSNVSTGTNHSTEAVQQSAKKVDAPPTLSEEIYPVVRDTTQKVGEVVPLTSDPPEYVDVED